ncbi:hypothetical protein FQN54_005231 [Arachnomyces sp. PD_36]|nr:hypothetical protein FQN54_005231 [Arachnomyces sp. PD_36]
MFLLAPGYMAMNANRITTESKFATHGGDDRVEDGKPGFQLSPNLKMMDGETEVDFQDRVCPGDQPLICPKKSQCCDKLFPWCCGTTCCPRGFPFCKEGKCYADP